MPWHKRFSGLLCTHLPLCVALIAAKAHTITVPQAIMWASPETRL
jgi:hypothetical protein